MRIGPAELAQLLEESWIGAAPREAARLRVVVDTIHATNVTADQQSASSLFLRQVVEEHRLILTPKAYELLASSELYGVPVNFADATARLDADRRQIFLLEGMQQLLHFYVSLIRVMDLLLLEQPDYAMTVGETQLRGNEIAGMAGFSLLADAIQTGRDLGVIDDLIHPPAFQNARLGYQGAILFVLLHELGHIELGHVRSGLARSEVHEVSGAYPEEIRFRQRREFEADAFALDAILPHMRPSFMGNVLFFLGPYAFIETFMAPQGTAHPLAVNRIHRLIQHSGFSADEARVAAGAVESYLGMLKREAAGRALHDDRRGRIAEAMPVDVAYKVFATIRNDLAASNQLLGQFEVG